MNTTTNLTASSGFSSVLAQSAKFALQWRLVLLWVVALLIPTAIMTLPLWQIMSAQLNNSVYAGELAHKLNMNAINDIMYAMSINKLLLQEAGIGALLSTLALSPFLSGAIVTAARSSAPLATGRLVHGGIAEYWRMFRMMVWAIVPFGIAGGVTAGVMHWSDANAENAILQSSADFGSHIALATMVILLIVADASLDAARAQFVHNTSRRSVIKAWWTGVKLVFKRPLTTLGFFILITVIGLIVAFLFACLREQFDHVSLLGFVIGLILTQLIVATSAWIKGARLFALASMSR